KMRHRLLDDTPTDAHASYQPPIAVDLPVLPPNRVAQIHAASEPHVKPKKIPKVGTTSPNQPSAQPNPLIRLRPLPVETRKLAVNCSSWAKTRLSAKSLPFRTEFRGRVVDVRCGSWLCETRRRLTVIEEVVHPKPCECPNSQA